MQETLKKILIVGNKSDTEFTNFCDSLWSGSDNIFPFIFAEDKLAEMSSLVCGFALSNINNPSIIIVYHSTLSAIELQSHNKNIEYIFFISESNTTLQQEQILNDINLIINTTFDFEKTSADHNIINDVTARQQINKQPMNNKNNIKTQFKPRTGDIEINSALIFFKPCIMQRRLEFQVMNQLVLATSLKMRFASIKKIPENIWLEFYKEHAGQPWLAEQCKYLSEHALFFAIVSGKDIITKIRNIIGNKDPKLAQFYTIRYVYGVSIEDNGMHCSDSEANFLREQTLIYPNTVNNYPRK